MDLDMCLLEVKPSAYDDDLLANARVDKWEQPNKHSLMVIKQTNFEIIFGFPLTENAKEFFFLGRSTLFQRIE